jgi:hypothetical protein
VARRAARAARGRQPTGVSAILEEIRASYQALGIVLDTPATYGTYYRLRCAACGALLGSVGDRLLPGLIQAVLAQQFDLYAAGLLGCPCGHQAARARALDPARAEAARARFG